VSECQVKGIEEEELTPQDPQLQPEQLPPLQLQVEQSLQGMVSIQ
jgi:hypothetical protein